MLQLENEKAPAGVRGDQGEGGDYRHKLSTDEFIKRRFKRKNGNVWYEEGGRYLWKYGKSGATCFDTWIWFGQPLRRRP